MSRIDNARVAIIGGGIAGLTVAQELVVRGVNGIVLLEGGFCGSGATGRSSGFITPPSELGLTELRRRFGDEDTRTLWNGARDSCSSIGSTIDRFAIRCGRITADSLYVASSDRDFVAIEEEHRAFDELGYESTLYAHDALRSVIGTTTYGGGIRFGGTFAIDPHEYARSLAAILAERGVDIREYTPVTKVDDHEIVCANTRIRAEKIFVCADFGSALIRIAKRAVFHAQTFIVLSEPLSDDIVRSLFPAEPLLVWDTDLIYQYFRLTADRRLLVGGGLLSRTYARSRPHDRSAIHHVVASMRKRFPVLERVSFEFDWNGLIGVTKDLLPLAGRLDDDLYVALCASGLPWSVAAAKTSVGIALDRSDPLERFFDPRRSFTDLDLLQPLLGRRTTFALSHAYAKGALRGDAIQVARRKRVTVASLLASAAALLGWRIRRWK